jgi:CubicO group peptidase (beta-lactamase class C family)
MPFLFAVLLQNGARADDPLARQVDGRSFDQFMQVALQDYAVPGAVVVVSSAHGTSFLKGYGVRRQGTADAVDENTRFQIASMSKFIAATAVGVLVDRGVVSWDVPMQTFSPETVLTERYATENATLRDYFAHRTGLPAYGGDLLTQLGYSPDELVRRALRPQFPRRMGVLELRHLLRAAEFRVRGWCKRVGTAIDGDLSAARHDALRSDAGGAVQGR